MSAARAPYSFATTCAHLFHGCDAGKGGDGCTAFQREKYKPYGPPSGGNGGRGGSVYIRAVKNITSLASVAKRVVAPPGLNGQGTWRNGARVPDVYIDVPVGTVVREVRRVREVEEENERRRIETLSPEERANEEREKRPSTPWNEKNGRVNGRKIDGVWGLPRLSSTLVNLT